MSLSTDVGETESVFGKLPTALWHRVFNWLNELDLLAEEVPPHYLREEDLLFVVRLNANELEYRVMKFPQGWFLFEELLFPPFFGREGRLSDEDTLDFLRGA